MTNESHRDIDLRTQTEGVVVHDSEWVRLDEPVYPVAVKPYRGLLAFFPVGWLWCMNGSSCLPRGVETRQALRLL